MYCPQDYRYAFSLKTTDQSFVFYAKTREEREILVHELYNICKEKNQELEMASARRDVMDRIDPISSFNAWNLSMICGPITVHQDSFQKTSLRHKRDSISEQAQIIKAHPEFVSYIRDGVRCFVSETLRKELYITDGVLQKESKTKLASINGKYRELFVMVDFRALQIKFRKNEKNALWEEEKAVMFSEVIEVKKLDLDIFKGEHKKSK